MALEGAGYRVLTRNRAAGCVGMIISEKPDLVLVDVNMPDTGGDAVVRLFAQAQPNSRVIVLLFSGMPEAALQARTVASGAHGYVRKSNSMTDLLRQVDRWLDPAGPKDSRYRRWDSPRPAELISTLDPPSSGANWNVAGTSANSSGARLAVGGPKVLFVDDDMAVLSAYRRAVQAEGFEVEFALSGEKALRRILSDEPPQVVVCDLTMPFPDGPEVYRQARSADPTWADRFIFLTGNRDNACIWDLRKLFPGPILFKPVDDVALRNAVLRCVLLATSSSGGSASGGAAVGG